MKIVYRILFSAFLLLQASFVFSAETADTPDKLIESVTNDVLNIVKQDKDSKSVSSKTLNKVEERVIPIFNFPHMTALAVGKGWRKANAEQKKELADQFKTLLIRSYSGALTKFRNLQFTYRPYKADNEAKEAKISVDVKEPGKPTLLLEYSLEKLPNGWKVYDVVADNVSLIVSFREGFSKSIEEKGIDGFIAELKDKNQQLANAQESKK